jgi:flagellin-specific chaperone FliS
MIHTYQKKKLPLSSKKCATQMLTGKWFITLMQSTVLPIQNMEMTIQRCCLQWKAAIFEHLKLFLNEVLKNNLVTPVFKIAIE